jgi:hypothetical protein
VTLDGGHSLLAVQDGHHATRLGRVSAVVPSSADIGVELSSGVSASSLSAPIPAIYTSPQSGTFPSATAVSPLPQTKHAVPSLATPGFQATRNVGGHIKAQEDITEAAKVTASSHTLVFSSLPEGSGREAQAVRTFVQALTAYHQAGVPWVGWKVFKKEMLQLQSGPTQPYRTQKQLLAAVTRAHSRGDLHLKSDNGEHWLALPGVSWPGETSTPSSSLSQQHDESQSSLSEPEAEHISYAPILRAIGNAHKCGYPLVGVTYVAAQAAMWRFKLRTIKNPFQTALHEAVNGGHVIIADVDHATGGQWVYLPENSAYRRPTPRRTSTRKIPSPGDPTEFDQLLAYLPLHQQVLRRTVRVHFKTEVPDTPHGQDTVQLDEFLDRAEAQGLIVSGGSGKKEAWVQRKD